jgi:hypothetical protein
VSRIPIPAAVLCSINDIPNLPPILADHEAPHIEGTASVDIRALENIKAHLATSCQAFDVDTLLQIQTTSQKQMEHHHWIITIASTAGTLGVMVTGCVLHSRFRYLFHCNADNSCTESNRGPRVTSQKVSATEHVTNSTQSEHSETLPSQRTHCNQTVRTETSHSGAPTSSTDASRPDPSPTSSAR